MQEMHRAFRPKNRDTLIYCRAPEYTPPLYKTL